MVVVDWVPQVRQPTVEVAVVVVVVGGVAQECHHRWRWPHLVLPPYVAAEAVAVGFGLFGRGGLD